MKPIPLTQGKMAWVDDEDYARISKYKWYAMYHKRTRSFYARTTVKVGASRIFIYMHRAVLRAGTYVQVDHANHDTLMNTRWNLKATTSTGNNRNRRLLDSNTSGFCGLERRKGTNKWVAKIKVHGKRKHLGTFDSKDDAIAARVAANILYGFHPNHGKAVAKKKNRHPLTDDGSFLS